MEAQERWYREVLPLNQQIVVDVGANNGRLSEFFYRAGNGSSYVVSVEPLTENVREIAARIAAAQASERWKIEACAAAAYSGQIVLQKGSSEGTAWNSVVAADQQRFPAEGRVCVPCKPLSVLAAEATVVKIDIEGHEYEVLDEALPKLPEVRAWALELHMRPARALSRTTQAFIQRGYTVLGAGRRRSDASDVWGTAKIPPTMEWDAVPVARRNADGSVFKMLHVVAIR